MTLEDDVALPPPLVVDTLGFFAPNPVGVINLFPLSIPQEDDEFFDDVEPALLTFLVIVVFLEVSHVIPIFIPSLSLFDELSLLLSLQLLLLLLLSLMLLLGEEFEDIPFSLLSLVLMSLFLLFIDGLPSEFGDVKLEFPAKKLLPVNFLNN